jgi:hypothetical protein
MKYFIVVCAFMLAACTDGSSDVTLGGSADLNVRDNLTECYVRQNGTSLVVHQNGLDRYTFIFDSSIVYPDEYLTLTEADALRITPLTVVEQSIIDGVL